MSSCMVNKADNLDKGDSQEDTTKKICIGYNSKETELEINKVPEKSSPKAGGLTPVILPNSLRRINNYSQTFPKHGSKVNLTNQEQQAIVLT